jgi:site-specific recombinase XerD
MESDCVAAESNCAVAEATRHATGYATVEVRACEDLQGFRCRPPLVSCHSGPTARETSVQRYFSNMATSPLARESRDKVRDVLSSVLRSAVEYGFLLSNPVDNVRMPAERRGKKRNKPYLTVQQFDKLVKLIPEPYATMVYVAIYTGLRVSELAGLRWEDIHEDSITIDERYCRADWGAPKSDCSNATIAVNPMRC